MATVSSVTNQPLAVNATGTSNVLIAGVSGYAIVVRALALTFETSEDPAIKTGGGATLASFRNLTWLKLDEMECGDRFVLPPGESLVLDLPNGADCSGVVWYSTRRVA